MTPYVSSTSVNNGVDQFISNDSGVRKFKDCLTVANSGSVGCSFFHKYEFVASDHVTQLKREGIDQYAYLFLVPLVNRLAKKYSFNREINEERIKREKIILPVTEQGEIDFAFMSSFMQKIESNILKTTIEVFTKRQNVNKCECGRGVNWKPFLIEDIADIVSGRDIYERERTKGNIPYITATASNNGIGYFVDNINDTLEANCLSVNRNGSVGSCYFHPYKALYGNDTRKLRPHHKSKYASLFISMAIAKQKSIYSYGLKLGTGRLRKQHIMLPCTPTGAPDWSFMETVMQNIESRQIIYYLESIQKRVQWT